VRLPTFPKNFAMLPSRVRQAVYWFKQNWHTSRQILSRLIGNRSHRLSNYPDRSWFWPILEEYRDSEGRTLEEAEFANAGEFFKSETECKQAIATRRWMSSPKSEKDVQQLLTLLEAFFCPDEDFTYLEFGTCFGTTFARVLAHFPNAKGIGLEVNKSRFHVTCWLMQWVDERWNLVKRAELHRASVVDVPFAPNSIDAVFMDTSHVFPDDLEYIRHLTSNGVLRKGFVFVVDDPLHSGTDIARRQFISKESAKYKIITRRDKNLWWFFSR